MTTCHSSGVRPIGKKIFNKEDQELFASLSQDRNPVHMDPVAARRLMTGHQIVHGIHLLIVAIEYWQNDGDVILGSIKASFDNPVSVGDEVSFTQDNHQKSSFTITATVNGLICAQVTGTTAQGGAGDGRDAASIELGSSKEDYFIGVQSDPFDDPPLIHLNRKYVITPNSADFSSAFPRAHHCLGDKCLSAIASLSYFVGMICPGLHSIFSSLDMKVGHGIDGNGGLTFIVQRYDERVRLFTVAFQGCLIGSLKAFVRPSPHQQQSVSELSSWIRAGEFAGTRSLIIGGSRGLGEMTAKILAAGGGDVVITYATGAEDANRIKDEINSAGRGSCGTLKFDLVADSPGEMKIEFGLLNAVYFFATPRIARKKAEVFEQKLLEEFVDFYIGKFYELCRHLNAVVEARPIKVYFPSSVFVAERPRGMTEYAMAKAAAELLIEDINKSFKMVSVLATRLPRLSTDQTSSILKVSTGSNVEALLPVIRSMNAAG